MLFARVVSEGLAHNSYVVGNRGVAAVIDPRRDAGVYLDIAEKGGCRITHIFETHRNEDYVIGSLALASRCGAEIFHGAAFDFAYGRKVRDGDAFTFGSLSLLVAETPGHTEESISLVLRDHAAGEEPFMVFCGDTIFAGDIARTDFFGKARNGEMAQKIYDSITRRIFPLGDSVILCPAHGAGSACGTAIADHPFTTVGYEKATNPLIRMGRDRFVRERETEVPYFPPYFHTMERFNREGKPDPRSAPPLCSMSVAEADRLRKDHGQFLDVRAPAAFAGGHIPGSISLWRGGISHYAGWYLNYGDPVVLVDDYNAGMEQVAAELFRMGYDNITGIIAGGIGAWYNNAMEIGTTGTCSVQELDAIPEKNGMFLLDVRDIRNRREVGYIPGSHHIYAGELGSRVAEIPKDRPIYVYCDMGNKGSLAASILARNGFGCVTNVLGGMNAWVRAGLPVEH